MCYDNGYRDAATVNSLRLLDSYKNFVTFKDDTTILKLNKKEADLLHPYFEEILKRAIATYEKKYKMKLPGPGAGRGLSRSRRFRRAHPGHAGPRRARRHLRRSRRHGQPLRPPAGRFQLGQHAVARDEPRLHPHRHQSSRAALVHRRPRGPRGDAGIARMGRPRSRPTSSPPCATKSCCPSPISTAASSAPSIPSQVIVSYYQAGRICDYIQEPLGRRQAARHGPFLRRSSRPRPR